MAAKKTLICVFSILVGIAFHVEGSGHPNELFRWPNRTLPFTFDKKHGLCDKQIDAIWQMIDKFNSDMDGCLRIMQVSYKYLQDS